MDDSAAAVAVTDARRDFVLVHGAWHGGWCWRRVAPILATHGHRVFTPSLTGLGDRAHLASPSVTLQTHVDDIVQLIDAEELVDVVLVGHSYGGNVISGVADVRRDRLSQLVYVDAVVPTDMSRGATWSWSDFDSPQAREARLLSVRDASDAGAVLPAPPPAAFAVTDAADSHWLERRMRPMPIGTYTGSITFRNGGSDGMRRTYIAAAGPPYEPMTVVRERLRADPGWHVLAIDTGHDAMVTAPGPLARMLLEA